jgi:drug/metabolite transporter (DMT)-like permease
MLAIVLALASAIGYGGSDFAAGVAARGASIIRVTLLASAVNAATVALELPFAASHPPTAGALPWGALSGVGGSAGAFALYFGFRQAEFSIAAPLSAVAAAGFSVLAGLLLGERPTALALTGIVLALPAIVGVSATATGQAAKGQAAKTATTRLGGGVLAGLVAGGGFAVMFIALARAGSGSGLWPVAATQVTELVAAFVVAAATGNLRLPERRAQLLAVVTGVTGAAATILYFFASHDGFLAVTAVLTSLYPAVTILLARVMLGERLSALRLAGLGLAGACVALIAVGGAGGQTGQACTGSLECMCSR